jgi:hypothetical protein
MASPHNPYDKLALSRVDFQQDRRLFPETASRRRRFGRQAKENRRVARGVRAGSLLQFPSAADIDAEAGLGIAGIR